MVAPLFVGDSRAPRFVGDGPLLHDADETDGGGNTSRRAILAEVQQIGDVVLLRYALSDRFEKRFTP